MARHELLLLALLVAAPAVASEGPQTLLVVDSRPGDWIGQGQHVVYGATDGRFGSSRQNGINVWFDSADGFGGPHWFLHFAAERGRKIVPRQYEAAYGIRGASYAGLSFDGNSRGCPSSGRFLLSELEISKGGTVERLAIDFEQTCQSSAAALHGSFRINSLVSVTPRFGVADFFVHKGNAGTTTAAVTVALSMPADEEVSVRYSTQDGSAAAGTDYVPKTGTVRFPAGSTSQTITIPVIGDRLARGDKEFYVKLLNPAGAEIGDDVGRVEILDPNGDVTAMVIRSYGKYLLPGRGITSVLTKANAEVGLQPTGRNLATFLWIARGNEVWSADFAAPGDAPLLPGAYRNVQGYPFQDPGSAALSISGIGGACPHSASIGHFVIKDARYGDDGRLEHFGADFAQHCYGGKAHNVGTLRYRSTLRQLSVSDAVIADERTALFTVTLHPPANHRVSVRFETEQGSARAGTDYRSVSRRLVFAPGVSEQTVAVPLLEDRTGDRQFFGRLVAPRRAPLWIQQGIANF